MTRRAHRAWIAIAVAAAGAAGASAWWQLGRGDGAVPARLSPDDERVLARGREVYQAHCASCHGARLEGQPDWRQRGVDGRLPAPPHDASGHTWHHPDEILFAIVKHGVAKVAGMADYATAMPVYDGVLDDHDIVAVLSWIKSRWPADVRAKHDQVNRQARGAAR